MEYHVYVSNAGSDYFSHFVMAAASGSLSPQPDIALEAAPGAVATNAEGSLLFVALRAAGKLASFRVDRGSGKLSLIGAVEQEEGPPYLKTDHTDAYLLSSYYGAGQVAVHRIHADGSLSTRPLQTLKTDVHAHSIQTDRSNRFAFVPHTNPANAIFQFRFDEKSGRLTPNDPPKIQPATPEGPRHFAFHPTKDLLYSINENGSTISAHRLDPERGTLSSFQVVSTLPEGEEVEGNTTAEIKIAPDGRFVYGSNRGHDSLALFAVNEDGTLEARGHFPTEATPRFFELDPSGRFVYAVGQGSGYLQSYRIEPDSGALAPLERHEVGESPLWITFIARG